MLIAFSGKMGSGKTTATSRLRALLKEKGILSANVKFADQIYAIQEAVYKAANLDLPENGKDGKLLQFIGTEWGRSKDVNIWVNAFSKSVINLKSFVKSKLVITCDDCRFQNEAEKVKELGGYIIKLGTRPVDNSIVANRDREHASELGFDDSFVDLKITVSSIAELDEQLKLFMKDKFNIEL